MIFFREDKGKPVREDGTQSHGSSVKKNARLPKSLHEKLLNGSLSEKTQATKDVVEGLFLLVTNFVGVCPIIEKCFSGGI